MNNLTKEEYYQWVEENDSYPKHSHQWIVRTYTPGPFKDVGGKGHMFYRNFGPFETSGHAKSWIDNYKKQYTKPGFISKISIEAICGAL
jgi:hypothetical protein